LFRFTFFSGIDRLLNRQRLDFLGYQCPVVDTNIINQAGPVGSGFHSLAGANVQAV